MDRIPAGLVRRYSISLIGRNPLVRLSDRIQVLTVLLAVLVVMMMIPVVATIGTAVHDANARIYALQSESRNLVPAIAQAESTTVVERSRTSYTVWARWSAAGVDHSGLVPWPSPAKAGDKSSIWVDADGTNSVAPIPVSQATVDAVGLALTLWSGIAAVAVGIVQAARWRLDRARYSGWDRDIAHVIDNRGGHSSHPSDT